jgi:hypothetical protein
MIVWLASYPRSGNTLLRTVLHQTMGLVSASDEVGEAKVVGLTETARLNTGVTEISGDWLDYYESAKLSDKVFLIKTHRPPRDNQKAIYVIRDGRKALLSYSRFHRSFTKPPRPSLLDLVLGNDFYGDWTDHYRIWTERQNTLVVRYEDLINATNDLLESLATTVGYFGLIEPWKNPFEQLHQENPDFFRKGEAHWQGDTEWTSAINAVFFKLHGRLMVDLGYAGQDEMKYATQSIQNDFFDLMDAARRYLSERKSFEKICVDRQEVINQLKSICEQRDSLHPLVVRNKIGSVWGRIWGR